MDRIAPSRRDACSRWSTGRQPWRAHADQHWEVPVAELRARIPPSLEIDTFEGRAFVGVVPFTMAQVRLGPVWLGTFLETNVRTYVVGDGVPGVWFFSLDCDRKLVAAGGRAMYRLPYRHARLASRTTDATTRYSLERSGAHLAASWTVGDPHGPAALGTLAHFLTERYAMYGPTRGGGAYRLRVHHPPWPLHHARLDELDTDLCAGAPIDLVLASPAGVRVMTFPKQAVARGRIGVSSGR